MEQEKIFEALKLISNYNIYSKNYPGRFILCFKEEEINDVSFWKKEEIKRIMGLSEQLYNDFIEDIELKKDQIDRDRIKKEKKEILDTYKRN